MARPRERKYIKTNCSNCDKPLERPVDPKQPNRRYYCNASCYWTWLREKRPASEIRYIHEQGGLLAELQRVANLLGHLPTTKEMVELSDIYPSTYEKRFGSWYMAISNITDPSPEAQWDIAKVKPEDGGWLSGFADGESTFRVAKHKGGKAFTCIWGFQLRADDVYAAEEAKRILGLAKRPLRWWSRDTDRAKGINAGDAVRFYVRDIPTLYCHILPFFRRFPLRSKKKIEFILFAEAVELLFNHQSQGLHRVYPTSLKSRLFELKSELEQAKQYKHPSEIDNYLANNDPHTHQHYRRRVFQNDN